MREVRAEEMEWGREKGGVVGVGGIEGVVGAITMTILVEI